MALLAGAFGVASLTGSDGAGSPEAAVEDLFAAISEEDAIGVLQALAPSEREVLVPLLQRFAAELDRLEVSSDELDLQGLDGVDLDLSELQLATQPLSDDYAVVEVRSARFRSRFDLTDLPLAEALRGVVLPAAETPGPSSSQVSDLKLVTVREGGGWYVGVQASVARLAEDEAGVPGPDLTSGGIPERGAASPEEAARQLLTAIYAQDHRRMIELTPVSESAALHVWGPSILAAANGDDPGFRPVLRSLDLEVEDGDDGVKVVRPTAFRLTADYDGTTDEVVFDGRCVTRSSTPGDPNGAFRSTDCLPSTPDPLSTALSAAYALTGWSYPLPVAVVEHDGQWFVSPGRTLAHDILETFDHLDADSAFRVVRSYFGDEWALGPQEMFDACGVARPSADAPRSVGRAAYERCRDQLPEDYDGPYGGENQFGFGFFGGYIDEQSAGEDVGSASTTTVVGTTIPAPTTTTG